MFLLQLALKEMTSINRGVDMNKQKTITIIGVIESMMFIDHYQVGQLINTYKWNVRIV